MDIPPPGTKMGNSIILSNAPPAEPSQEEVEEYAKWMGMDLDAHAPLLWVAREALMAPLPLNWRACEDENGGGMELCGGVLCGLGLGVPRLDPPPPFCLGPQPQGEGQGCIGAPPPPPRSAGRPAYAQPLSANAKCRLQVAFVTDSNCPQPFGNLLQPPVQPPLGLPLRSFPRLCILGDGAPVFPTVSELSS